MNNLIFILCFSFFVGHELDAVTQAEWRLLYGFRHLEQRVAEPLFVLSHVPLLALLLWLNGHHNRKIREGSRWLLAGFTLVHAGLHYNLRDHPLYTFDSLTSQSLIFGCGLLGALYLLQLLRGTDAAG
ncbi:MAG: DUF6713 family protein [Pseudomonadota bacterium]